MATRGTYLIDGKLCYNHWDNYPSGAAAQLFNVLDKFGSLDLFSCIRGMDKLEPTKSKFDGRAEYHYVISGEKIECYSIPFDKDILVYVSGGPIEKWIGDNLELDKDDKPEHYKVAKLGNGYITGTAAKEKLLFYWNQGKKLYSIGHNGNATTYFSDFFRLANLMQFDVTAEKTEWLNELAPEFAKRYNHDSPAQVFNGYVDN